MDILIDYCKKNRLYVILGVMVWLSMFANLGGKGEYAYVLTMIFGAGYCIKENKGLRVLFLLMPVWIIISALANSVVTSKIFAFVLVLLCATPIISSYKVFLFRGKFLYAILMLLPVVTMFNLYAYHAGINYFLLLNYNVSDLNVSGFTQHPMYLGAINGASNVVLTYLLMKAKDGQRKYLTISIFVLLIASVYLSVVAASRSALASSLIGMATVVYLFSESSGKLVKSVLVITVITYAVMPMMKGGSTQIQMKMDNEQREGNSRSVAWNIRMDEFKRSPVFGLGFATAYDISKGEVVTGTVETGSGWLTVLSQTGFIGALLIFAIIMKCYVPLSELKDDRGVLVLFSCELLYFCLHSVFEGYIFTPGYCTCLCFWLLVGFMYDYSIYKHQYEYVQDEVGYLVDYDDEYDDEDEEYEDENDDEYEDDDDDMYDEEDEYDDEDEE